MNYPLFDSELVLVRLKPESLNERIKLAIHLGIQVQWFAALMNDLIICKPDYSTLSY